MRFIKQQWWNAGRKKVFRNQFIEKPCSWRSNVFLKLRLWVRR
jgi:hypothetical protein